MLANKAHLQDSPGTFNTTSNLTTLQNVNCRYFTVNKATSIDSIQLNPNILNSNEYNSNQLNAFNSSPNDSILILPN